MANLLEMNIRENLPFLAYLSACGTGEIRNERFLMKASTKSVHVNWRDFFTLLALYVEVNDELCIDMARITYEGIRDGGVTDECVCRGLQDASRKLRNHWLNMPTKVRRGRS